MKKNFSIARDPKKKTIINWYGQVGAVDFFSSLTFNFIYLVVVTFWRAEFDIHQRRHTIIFIEIVFIVKWMLCVKMK